MTPLLQVKEMKEKNYIIIVNMFIIVIVIDHGKSHKQGEGWSDYPFDNDQHGCKESNKCTVDEQT